MWIFRGNIHLGDAGFKLWLHTSKVLCFHANCPERSTFRYLSSQHGLGEAIKNKFALRVFLLPFDVLREIFLWKPSALAAVEVKSGQSSHEDHIRLLITRRGLFQSIYQISLSAVTSDFIDILFSCSRVITPLFLKKKKIRWTRLIIGVKSRCVRLISHKPVMIQITLWCFHGHTNNLTCPEIRL